LTTIRSPRSLVSDVVIALVIGVSAGVIVSVYRRAEFTRGPV